MGIRQPYCRLASATEGLLHRLHPLLQQLCFRGRLRDLLLQLPCLSLQREVSKLINP